MTKTLYVGTERFRQVGNSSCWISTEGRIWDSQRGRYRQPAPDGNGYLQVSIGGRKLSVHRLVAGAFLANPEQLDTVNHRNEVRQDNRLVNLEWLSGADNTRYSQAKSYSFWSPDGELVHITGLSQFAREQGLSHGSLGLVLSGERQQHKGWRAFIFDYGVPLSALSIEREASA